MFYQRGDNYKNAEVGLGHVKNSSQEPLRPENLKNYTKAS
jgi:hypothetical protein